MNKMQLYVFLTNLHILPPCWAVRRKDLTQKQFYQSLYMCYCLLNKWQIFQIP